MLIIWGFQITTFNCIRDKVLKMYLTVFYQIQKGQIIIWTFQISNFLLP